MTPQSSGGGIPVLAGDEVGRQGTGVRLLLLASRGLVPAVGV